MKELREDLEIDNIFAMDFPEATLPAGNLTEADLTTEWLGEYNRIDAVNRSEDCSVSDATVKAGADTSTSIN